MKGNDLSAERLGHFQFQPICCGSFSNDFLENPVEMRQRLKADLVSDFADAKIGIQQQVPSAIDPHPADIFGEIDFRGLLEHLAEVKTARVYCFRYLAERNLVAVILL